MKSSGLRTVIHPPVKASRLGSAAGAARSSARFAEGASLHAAPAFMGRLRGAAGRFAAPAGRVVGPSTTATPSLLRIVRIKEVMK